MPLLKAITFKSLSTFTEPTASIIALVVEFDVTLLTAKLIATPPALNAINSELS